MPEQAAFAARGGCGAPAILPIRGQGLTLVRGARTVLSDVDMDIRGPGTLVIMGPNGAGKSLLVRVLAGLVSPKSGSITWAGTPPDRRRASKLGFVFQHPVHLRRSALANITYALAVAGVPRSQREEKAHTALVRTGIAHLANAPARVLSGGEQQLVAIARALATDPEVLVLDEPTSALDPATTSAIEAVVQSVSREGVRVVLITHDVGQARRLGDEIAFLHRGRLLERTLRDAFWRGPRSAEAHAFIQGEIVL